jgi:hypothetical protein
MMMTFLSMSIATLIASLIVAIIVAPNPSLAQLAIPCSDINVARKSCCARLWHGDYIFPDPVVANLSSQLSLCVSGFMGCEFVLAQEASQLDRCEQGIQYHDAIRCDNNNPIPINANLSNHHLNGSIADMQMLCPVQSIDLSANNISTLPIFFFYTNDAMFDFSGNPLINMPALYPVTGSPMGSSGSVVWRDAMGGRGEIPVSWCQMRNCTISGYSFDATGQNGICFTQQWLIVGGGRGCCGLDVSEACGGTNTTRLQYENAQLTTAVAVLTTELTTCRGDNSVYQGMVDTALLEAGYYARTASELASVITTFRNSTNVTLIDNMYSALTSIVYECKAFQSATESIWPLLLSTVPNNVSDVVNAAILESLVTCNDVKQEFYDTIVTDVAMLVSQTNLAQICQSNVTSLNSVIAVLYGNLTSEQTLDDLLSLQLAQAIAQNVELRNQLSLINGTTTNLTACLSEVASITQKKRWTHTMRVKLRCFNKNWLDTRHVERI